MTSGLIVFVVVLFALGYVSFIKGEVLVFLTGLGIALFFIVFVVPGIHGMHVP